MGSRLSDLPMRLLMPSSFDNVKEFAIKTDPSVSKVEIKSFFTSIFGFEIERVRTLNMKGKKKVRQGGLVARPDYKKAYVTLKTPVFYGNLVPDPAIEEETMPVSNQKSTRLVQKMS